MHHYKQAIAFLPAEQRIKSLVTYLLKHLHFTSKSFLYSIKLNIRHLAHTHTEKHLVTVKDFAVVISAPAVLASTTPSYFRPNHPLASFSSLRTAKPDPNVPNFSVLNFFFIDLHHLEGDWD